MRISLFVLVPILLLTLGSCSKEEDPATPSDPVPSGPRLILKFKFDSTQVRLNNLGQPSTVPPGHGAQSPIFDRMSAHYVEFAPNATTQLGDGEVVYTAPETTLGGALAIDHDLCIEATEGQEFVNIPLSDLAPGTYQWLRVSLSYQNYDIRLYWLDLPFTGTVASFLGYNTYISSYLVNDSTVTVNGNRSQGYWGFEIHDPPIAQDVLTGQAPGTTVPNPINGTSPVPPGSCVVTGAFPIPLTITGNETEDVIVEVSLSTNKSFEWIDPNGNGRLDVETGLETIVDMGIRGLIPTVL